MEPHSRFLRSDRYVATKLVNMNEEKARQRKEQIMKVLRNGLGTLAVVALLGALLLNSGCDEATDAKAASDVALCTACGQIKGADSCCSPDAVACAGCELAKGSPGCCKIEKGAEEAAICSQCGQIKGTDECCKPGQATCAGCDLVKGSPGCCKLPKS